MMAPEDLAKAQRWATAKNLMTAAARAAIANAPNAVHLCEQALAELKRATVGEPEARP